MLEAGNFFAKHATHGDPHASIAPFIRVEFDRHLQREPSRQRPRHSLRFDRARDLVLEVRAKTGEGTSTHWSPAQLFENRCCSAPRRIQGRRPPPLTYDSRSPVRIL